MTRLTQTAATASNRWAGALAALVCFLIVGHFVWRFVGTAANIAFADDIVDALWFFEIFRQTEGWWGKLGTLFLPNHEHILLFDHVIYLLYYALAGELNFLHFVLIGNVSLLWLAWLLWRWGREYIDGRVALILAVAFTFQLFSSESNFYSVASLSTKFVFIFAMMAFLYWQRHPNAIAVPLMWAMLAISVQFNGLLVLLVLVLAGSVYAVMGQPLRVKQLLCWGVASLLLIAAYIAYESPLTLDHLVRHVQATDAHKAHEFARNVSEWQKQMDLQHAELGVWNYFWRFTASLCILIGATIWPSVMPGSLLMANVTGAVMLAGLMYLAVHGWWRKPFWLALVLWVMASLIMLAIGRGISLGEAASFASRYRYYSFLLLFLFVVPLWQCWAKRTQVSVMKQVVAAGLIAAFISWAGVTEWRAVADMIGKVQTSYRYLLVDGGLARSQMPFYPHNLDHRLLNAHHAGYFSIYRVLPEGFKPQVISALSEPCPLLPAAEQAIRAYSKNPRALAVELMFEFMPSEAGDEVWLCGAQGGLVLQLGNTQRQMDSAVYFPQVVLKSQLAPAHYQVYARPVGGTQWRAIGAIEFR